MFSCTLLHPRTSGWRFQLLFEFPWVSDQHFPTPTKPDGIWSCGHQNAQLFTEGTRIQTNFKWRLWKKPLSHHQRKAYWRDPWRLWRTTPKSWGIMGLCRLCYSSDVKWIPSLIGSSLALRFLPAPLRGCVLHHGRCPDMPRPSRLDARNRGMPPFFSMPKGKMGSFQA